MTGNGAAAHGELCRKREDDVEGATWVGMAG